MKLANFVILAAGKEIGTDKGKGSQDDRVDDSPASAKEPNAIPDASTSTVAVEGQTCSTQMTGFNPGLASLLPQQVQAPEEANELSSKVSHL